MFTWINRVKILLSFSLLLSLYIGPLCADTEEPAVIKDQDQLLEKVRAYQQQEKKLYQQREKHFLQDKNHQQQLLNKAQTGFLQAQKETNPLQLITDQQASKIKGLRQQLQQEVVALGDVYSIYNEFSGDFTARMQDSLIQAQLPQRQLILERLNQQQTLPSIQQMIKMWELLQEEMTESGKNGVFKSTVVNVDGSRHETDILRFGTFSAVDMNNDQALLHFLAETQELLKLKRQPQDAQKTMQGFVSATHQSTVMSGALGLAVFDPSRGGLLSVLGQSPSLKERILQGREVGMAIIALGVAGLLLALYRLVYLALVWMKTKKQLGMLDQVSSNNPLGRVFQQVNNLDDNDEELLQLSLDEAILKELPALERGQSLIKLFAAIAPLLGLLGTVIGMIATFQSISLFGSGDPKLMASGISQALVTTVLGLVVAIPLLLSHNLLASFSRSLVQILDEQSAGLLARNIEEQRLASQRESV